MALSKLCQWLWNDWLESSSLIASGYQQENTLSKILSNTLSKDHPIIFIFLIWKMHSMNETWDNESAKDILNFTEIMKPIHLRTGTETQT